MRWISALFWMGMAFGFAGIVLRLFTVWGWGLLAIAVTTWLAGIWIHRRSNPPGR
jgi:hypothetical protein